jgi:hypothetical protein
VHVHTPRHGSWLNLIEMIFSKMARPFPASYQEGQSGNWLSYLDCLAAPGVKNPFLEKSPGRGV